MREIPSFPNYKIDEFGNIFSFQRGWSGRKLSKNFNKAYGYYSKQLVNELGIKEHCLIHRLVAMTYHPLPCYKGLEVNHKDGDKLNNHKDNLEWVTPSENQKHAYREGLKSSRGENNSRNILKEEDVIKIYNKLLEGESNMVLAKQYNVHPATIKDIKTKKNWNYLLKELPDIKLKARKLPLQEDDVNEICKLLEKSYSVLDVVKMMSKDYVTEHRVYDIKRKRSFKYISCKYDF